MLILCAVFFLLPFILRGARESVDNIRNDVADWLPQSFTETGELKFFRDFFVGDQFVVVSWDGCNERDPRYKLFYEKVKDESLAGEQRDLERLKSMDPDSPAWAELDEEIKARRWGTELGLQETGNHYQDWGEHKEKWLLGRNKQWYFVCQNGSVFKWSGKNNVIDAGKRFVQRFLNGRNRADGTFVRQWGAETNNRFYRNPELLSARFFVDVTSGPDIFKRMAGVDGTMLVGNYSEGDRAAYEAAVETHKRLTGVLFGPTPPTDFQWTVESLIRFIPEDYQRLIDERRAFEFNRFVDELVAQKYGGDIERLKGTSQATRLGHWYDLWQRLEIDPPPRQTCLVITLNEPVLHELARAVGRPVLGKPRGRILELASGDCGINPENLHIGGPPVDNVAIDEEGSITLFRLVGLSAVIGIALAWLSFRSLRITLMVFFVGGTTAIGSIAIVYFLGGTMDAILMTMPSLIYVLGLSGAVHVVNYYREACRESGEGRAADIAVRNGLFPCALAAFTTALGLISLCTSNLTPINKFGFYSAIATIATVVFLFSYLPAALTIWPPGYRRRDPGGEATVPRRWSFTRAVERSWDRIGQWVVGHHALVVVTMLIVMVVTGLGLAKIQTSVQLLKLFRSDAKILGDYAWMENHLGKLVPMEVLLMVDSDAQIRPDELPEPAMMTNEALLETDLKMDVLERIELSDRIRRYVLEVFGDESVVPEKRIIGNVMSTDLTTPLKWAVGSQLRGAPSRIATNSELEYKRDALLDQDYLRVDPRSREELWRISLRLAALNDVDYGEFVGEIKTVVEPVLAAYRYRLEILKKLHEKFEQRDQGRVLVLGLAPEPRPQKGEPEAQIGLTRDGEVNQTGLFVNTLRDLLENSGFRYARSPSEARTYDWRDPEKFGDPSEQLWQKFLSGFDVVVVVGDNPRLDMNIVRKHASNLVTVDDYQFLVDPETRLPLEGMVTAAQRKAAGDENALVKASYTGIVPIVYKAQRSLLKSLVESIMLAFVMIAATMMVLLRPWGRRLTWGNVLNFRAGLLSMIPNVLPMIVVFGLMGHLGNLVDIGSMMTASVAMGVAVDDTIHFLTWFRDGISRGLNRLEAIAVAYRKVATAMTQTTLIAGFGLAAFAFSTFMPTQRFGILMLFLLIAALVGDLILLPAILAGPLGKCFCSVAPRAEIDDETDDDDHASDESMEARSPSGMPLESAASGNGDPAAQKSPPVKAPHITAMRRGAREPR